MSKLTPEQIATMPKGTQKIIKGIYRQFAMIDKIQIEYDNLRAKGLFPGKPGDPINIG
jgi:hypothetical protein